MSTSPEVLITVITGTVLLLLLVVFIIVFLLVYQKRKFVHLQEKERMRDVYDRELLRVQLEVQEETFQQISRDIHDNVGQVLAVVRLYLKGMNDHSAEDQQKRLHETDELVGNAINDLRNLSHSLSSEHIRMTGLAAGLRTEIERIANTGRLKAHFIFTGSDTGIDYEKELILFRMSQELLANVIRHSRAQNLEIKMDTTEHELSLSICDDGRGFIPETNKGNGLSNLHKRAELIGATFKIDSSPGKGTKAQINYRKLN
jgi:signal transduction histidine kinase